MFDQYLLTLNMPVFGKTSLSRLEGVHPKMVLLMKTAILTSPIDFSVDQGVRTRDTQARYYSWGRWVVNPNTGPIPGNKFGMIVTNRDGITKKSEHQSKQDGYGHAVDIYPYYGRAIHYDDVVSLKIIAKHIKSVALKLDIKIRCGIDWKSPYDPPHFELA